MLICIFYAFTRPTPFLREATKPGIDAMAGALPLLTIGIGAVPILLFTYPFATCEPPTSRVNLAAIAKNAGPSAPFAPSLSTNLPTTQ